MIWTGRLYLIRIWNKSSGGALQQIKKRNYPEVLEDYGGEIVMVGINYDAVKKKHSCVIERCRC